MWRDALRTLALVARDLIFAGAFILGVTLTLSAARLGWSGNVRCLFRTCCPASKAPPAKARLMAARDAVIGFMIDQSRCPTGEPELLDGHYLSAEVAEDPWGTRLFYHCEASPPPDGAAYVDFSDQLWVISAGPDRVFGTADDISSRDL
jgi:hypothetical protein